MNEIIDNINETFGIDIRCKNSNRQIMLIKYYLLKTNIERPHNEIAQAFGITEFGLYDMKRRLQNFKNMSEIKEIGEIIENSDVNIFHTPKPRRETQDETPAFNRPYSLYQAIEYLRKNPRDVLWNKQFNKWTIKDFQNAKSN